MAIQSFACRDTERFFAGQAVARFANIAKVLSRKLQQLDGAVTLEFLKAPPGKRLEALQGDRAGQHSIRINDQYRICFVWMDPGPRNVEVTDYH